MSLTTALGLVTTYEVEELPNGDLRRVRTDPGGAQTVLLAPTDGRRQVTHPDGTVATLVFGPDPRFGMQAPLLQRLTVTTPGGKSGTRTAARTVALSAPDDPFSLTSQTDTVVSNGRTFTETYWPIGRSRIPPGRRQSLPESRIRLFCHNPPLPRRSRTED